MSDETVESLSRAKQEIDDLVSSITNFLILFTGEAIGGAAAGFTDLSTLVRNFGTIMRTAWNEGLDAAAQQIGTLGRFKDAVVELTDAQKREVDQLLANGIPSHQIFDTSLGANEASVLAYIKSLNTATVAQVGFTDQLKAAQIEVAGMSKQMMDNLKAGLKMGVSTQELAETLGLSESAVRLLKDRIAEHTKELKDNAKAQDVSNVKVLQAITGYVALYDIIAKLGRTRGLLPPLPVPGANWTINAQSVQDILDMAKRQALQGGLQIDVQLKKPDLDTFGKSLMSELARLDLGGAIVQAIRNGESVVRAGFSVLGQAAGNVLGQAVTVEVTKSLEASLGPKMAASIGALAGSVASAAVGIVGVILNDILAPSYTAIEQVAMRARRSVEEVTSALQQMGQVGAQALANLTSSGFSLDSFRSRFTGMDEANSLLDMVGQFPTQAELQQQADQWKAVYDYMLQSGLYTTAQLSQAWRQYQDAVNAASGIPAGALGFPTRAELEQAAADAEAAYTYMRDSGLYTADVLERAWQQWQDALIASGNTAAIEAQKLKQQMDQLKSEYDSVWASIAEEQANPEYDEAGNRIYGVIEQRGLDRLEEIKAQQTALALEAAQAQMGAQTQVTANAEALMGKSFDKAKFYALELDQEMRQLFSRPYELTFTTTGLPGGVGFGASGGLVTSSGIQYMGMGGWVPRGTDTVRAMLTPGEFVVSRQGVDALASLNRGDASGFSSRPPVVVNIHNPVVRSNRDIRELSRQVARDLHKYRDLMGADQ